MNAQKYVQVVFTSSLDREIIAYVSTNSRPSAVGVVTKWDFRIDIYVARIPNRFFRDGNYETGITKREFRNEIYDLKFTKRGAIVGICAIPMLCHTYVV